METVQKKLWSCFCSCLTKTFNQWNILMTFAHVRVMIHSSVLWLSNCKNQSAHGNTAIGKVKFLFLKYFSLLFTRLSIKNRSVIVFWRTTAKAFEHSKAQLKYFNMCYGCVNPLPATAPDWAHLPSGLKSEPRHFTSALVASCPHHKHYPQASAVCHMQKPSKGKKSSSPWKQTSAVSICLVLIVEAMQHWTD